MFDSATYRKNYYAERRKQRKAERLCTKCGVKLPLDCKISICVSCAAKQREYTKKYYHEKKCENVSSCREATYDIDEANICLTCEKKYCSGICAHYLFSKKLLEENK